CAELFFDDAIDANFISTGGTYGGTVYAQDKTMALRTNVDAWKASSDVAHVSDAERTRSTK
ncbi:hypothetical protein, partial [Vibrio cholerae]|uniref:hypothetical protein n=1 Tax=Vibrio cholerae TaxID=666 RepID=UPI001F228905